MLKVGFVGWRGMVGSVLLERMIQCGDFTKITPYFFSTSNFGGTGPDVGLKVQKLLDAYDLSQLSKMDCIVTTHGSDYTSSVLPKLRQINWNGFWLDASSCLRMDKDSIIVLDPINHQQIINGLASGVKQYIGGNCTVSLMLLAIDGLLQHDLVEWVSTMTYQAVSGAGANNMRELLEQNQALSDNLDKDLHNPSKSILDIDRKVMQTLLDDAFPTTNFKAPIIGNILPWIDVGLDNGQTKEEWKSSVEANKILGFQSERILIDGLCVRVGAMRSHSQALTIKLRQNIKLEDIQRMIIEGNQWVKFIDNNKEDTLKYLSPAAVSGSLDIAVGRLRKLKFGEEFITLFTVGDQLLWGAAEPIRRTLNIMVEQHA